MHAKYISTSTWWSEKFHCRDFLSHLPSFIPMLAFVPLAKNFNANLNFLYNIIERVEVWAFRGQTFSLTNKCAYMWKCQYIHPGVKAFFLLFLLFVSAFSKKLKLLSWKINMSKKWIQTVSTCHSFTHT